MGSLKDVGVGRKLVGERACPGWLPKETSSSVPLSSPIPDPGCCAPSCGLLASRLSTYSFSTSRRRERVWELPIKEEEAKSGRGRIWSLEKVLFPWVGYDLFSPCREDPPKQQTHYQAHLDRSVRVTMERKRGPCPFHHA